MNDTEDVEDINDTEDVEDINGTEYVDNVDNPLHVDEDDEETIVAVDSAIAAVRAKKSMQKKHDEQIAVPGYVRKDAEKNADDHTKELLTGGRIKISTLAKLRNTYSTQEFNRWLDTGKIREKLAAL